MDLLLDTNVLVWISTLDRRLSESAVAAMESEYNACYVSAVTAWEFVDLNLRGRFGADLDFAGLIDGLQIELLEFPAEAWRLADTLPNLHRDPVDRMLIAHALHSGLTLVTSDETMRSYPVQSLW